MKTYKKWLFLRHKQDEFFVLCAYSKHEMIIEQREPSFKKKPLNTRVQYTIDSKNKLHGTVIKVSPLYDIGTNFYNAKILKKGK